MQEEKPLYFMIMSIVMLILSVTLALLNLTFWPYMAIVSSVILVLATGISFFERSAEKEIQKDVKVEKEKISVKKEPENSATNGVHTGYFSHNY